MGRVPPSSLTSPRRRDFLEAVVGAAAGFGLGGPAWGAPRSSSIPSSSAPGVTPLSDSLFLISGCGANVVAATTADGVLLVDGGLTAHTESLLGCITRLSGGRPVKTAFNTHWHWDHTGSNEALRRAGAAIIAHENTRLWLGARIIVDWQHRTYPPRPPQALPTETFHYQPGRLAYGSQTVDYGYLPLAHTDGDMYVRFQRENVLAAGDVVAGGRYPILDYSTGGWIGGMIDALKSLLALSDGHTRFIPGAGPPRTRADLQAQLHLCETVKERIADAFRKAVSFEELMATHPTREFDAAWGDPAQFMDLAWHGALNHVRDLGRIF